MKSKLRLLNGFLQSGCSLIPAGTWVVFPCRGALPKALQDVNTKIWSEWLPSCGAYKLAGNYNIEMYSQLCENPDGDYSEIWIPVEKMFFRSDYRQTIYD